ncbi:MAG: NIPSNAP family protein [Dehalococcoidia bacterium]
MAVATIHRFRIKPGRLQEFTKMLAEGRKIHESLGGRIRVWQSTIAGEPNTISYVIEYDDMTAYAAFGDKLRSDRAWQDVVQKARGSADPSAELIGSSLVTSVEP